MTLARDQLTRASELFSAGLISRSQLSDAEARAIEADREHRNALASFDVSRIEAQSLATTLMSATRRVSNERELARARIRSALQSALARADAWCGAHVITASVDGVVSLATRASAIRTVKRGEELLAIVRPRRSVSVEMAVSEEVWPDVRPGQRVRLSIAAYPSARHGYVETSIETITGIPRQGKYLVIARLPIAATTNERRSVRLHDGMTGTARIRIGEQTVLQRLLPDFGI